jgi:hypothetical protein
VKSFIYAFTITKAACFISWSISGRSKGLFSWALTAASCPHGGPEGKWHVNFVTIQKQPCTLGLSPATAAIGGIHRSDAGY